MSRMLKTLALGLLLAAALTVVLPTPAQAQIGITPPAPVFVRPPVVTTYPAYSAPTYVVPSISYSAPVVTTYAAPRLSYYPAPVVSYAAPVVTYSAPVAATYSYAAPIVTTPAPGVYTTYTYWNGLGIFRPRYVNQTYYTPILP